MKRQRVSQEDLQQLAEYYFERFLPFFTDQKEGSINPQTTIEFSKKMKQKMGLAYLFEQKIRLNETYFAADPKFLAYTLFHEMTHLWLYNCHLDPGHTERFYKKMQEFSKTGLPIDKEVHVHSRVVPEGKFVYLCDNCGNRWHLRDQLEYDIFCGLCYKIEGVEYYANLIDPSQVSAFWESRRILRTAS